MTIRALLALTLATLLARGPARADDSLQSEGVSAVGSLQLTEARGHLAGARVVRDGYQVMLISTGGTVIKMPVEDVKRLGRSTQGVIVMRLRDGETVSGIAPVVESGDDAPAEDGVLADEPDTSSE